MTFRGQTELKFLTFFFTKLWGPYSYVKLKLNYFISKVTHITFYRTSIKITVAFVQIKRMNLPY